MWRPSVGTPEILLLMVVSCLLLLPSGFARRWAKGIVACFVVAMVVTPADPLSMLIVGLALSLAFTCGVLSAPHLRTTSDDRPAEQRD